MPLGVIAQEGNIAPWIDLLNTREAIYAPTHNLTSLPVESLQLHLPWLAAHSNLGRRFVLVAPSGAVEELRWAPSFIRPSGRRWVYGYRSQCLGKVAPG